MLIFCSAYDVYTVSNKQWGCIVRSEVPPVVNNHGQVSGINVDPAEAFGKMDVSPGWFSGAR